MEKIDKVNIGRIGVGVALVEAERNGIKFIELPSYHDRGIDAMIEYNNNDIPCLLMVQCKASTDTNFRSENNRLYYYFDDSHYNYWTKYPVKTIITYVDVNDVTKCYWNVLDKSTMMKAKTKYRVHIDNRKLFPNEELMVLLKQSNSFNIKDGILPQKSDQYYIDYAETKNEIKTFETFIVKIKTELNNFNSYIQCLLYNGCTNREKFYFKTYLVEYQKQFAVSKDKDYITTDYKLNFNHPKIENIVLLLENFNKFMYNDFTSQSKDWLNAKYPKLYFGASDNRFESKEFWENFFEARFGNFHK